MTGSSVVRGGRRAVCALLLAGLVAALAAAPAEGARRKKARDVPSTAELVNPLLSPRLSLWLVGPIARMATKEEIAAFGSAVTDEEAMAVIEAFWKKRDPAPQFDANPLREDFEKRAAEADRQFTEAGSLGRSSDRGTLFVLYGPPTEQDYEISDHPDDPPILVWKYDSDTAEGLDGAKPDRFYRFIRRGDRTVFFTPNRRPAKPRFGPP